MPNGNVDRRDVYQSVTQMDLQAWVHFETSTGILVLVLDALIKFGQLLIKRELGPTHLKDEHLSSSALTATLFLKVVLALRLVHNVHKWSRETLVPLLSAATFFGRNGSDDPCGKRGEL